MRTLAFGAAIVLGALITVPAISNQPLGPEIEGINASRISSTVIASSPVTLESLPAVSSTEPTVAGVPAGIGAIKSLADGSPVCICQKLVTATFASTFYVEEADRSAGIKIVCPPGIYPPSSINCLVSLSGVITTEGSERYVLLDSPAQIISTDAPAIPPLMIKSSALGGHPFNEYTPGIEQSIEMHNVGLKMRICGRVTTALQFDANGYFVYIDDGSHIKDGSYSYFDPSLHYIGVRVYCLVAPPENSLCIATGISSLQTYDPTTELPNSGDEYPIRVLLINDPTDIQAPGTGHTPMSFGTVSGRVRLVDNPSTPVPLRIYSIYDDVTMAATDEFKPFSLSRIPATGTTITASAPGYHSQSKTAAAGDSGIDFMLSPSEQYIEIKADKNAMKACSSETIKLTVLCRDCEGKKLANRAFRITTDRGTFQESGSRTVELSSDNAGLATVTFTAAPDGPGIAKIHATTIPESASNGELNITITGPSIKVTAYPDNLSVPGVATITATVTDGEEPVVGVPLQAITDWGTFEESASQVCFVETGLDGKAAVSLRIDDPGTARIALRHIDSCNNQVCGWTLVGYGSQPFIEDDSRLSSPLVADLNSSNDGNKEISLVTTAGVLKVWNNTGAMLWTQDGRSYGNNTPACGDIDHDPLGSLEVILASGNESRVRAYAGATGQSVAGWPTYSDYPFINVSAAIADANKDGSNEIIAGDQCCYVFAWNGTGNWEKQASPAHSFLWRNLTGSSGTAIYNSSVAVGDITGGSDGIQEIIVGTNDATEVFAFPGDAWGDFINPPYYVPGWPKDMDMRCESSAAIGDIDGDGSNDLAIGSDDSKIYIHYSGTNLWIGYPVGGSVRSSPALGDLDGNGKLDVVFGADDGRMYALQAGGTAVPGWEGGVLINDLAQQPIQASPAIGDVNGDGKLEVLVGTLDGYLLCIYNDANAHQTLEGYNFGPIAWAKKCTPAGTDAVIMSCPTIDDLDGDGNIDILVAGSAGLYRFELEAPFTSNRSLIPWPTFRGNIERTGCIAPPAPPTTGSIVGRIRRSGVPVEDAMVYITKSDDSPVYTPGSDPPTVRPPVKSVGVADLSEYNDGGYAINQLPPNTTYKLRIVTTGNEDTIIPDIQVTTGVLRIDIEL